MPRNTRNFWLEADIDGRSTTLEGGPVSRNGGFSLTIYIRDNGSILRAVEVNAFARSDGTLAVNVGAASDVAHSHTGNIEPEGIGFTITTESGRPAARRPRMVTRDEVANSALPENDETYSALPEGDEAYLEHEYGPEATSAPFGRDPFGHPY